MFSIWQQTSELAQLQTLYLHVCLCHACQRVWEETRQTDRPLISSSANGRELGSGARCLGPNAGPDAYNLCDPGQITSSLFPRLYRGDHGTCLMELLEGAVLGTQPMLR